MNSVAFDGYVLFALVMAGSVCSVHLAGRMAEHRGRRFKTWAWIAAAIGPLALPLLFLFPSTREHRPE